MRQCTGSSTGVGWGDRQYMARPVRFVTYNILNGRYGGLQYALRVMSQANVDLGVFQETKFTKGIYPRELGGYQVVVPKSPSLHSSGITMFYLKSDHFTVSAIRLRVTNVVRFQLTLGGQ